MDNDLFESLERQANEKKSFGLFFNKILSKARFIFIICRINFKLFMLLSINVFFVIAGIIHILKLIL